MSDTLIREAVPGDVPGLVECSIGLFAEDGYRVIDWGTPAVAPARIDLVWLLAEAGTDPFPYVDPADYGVAYFLHLRWAVVAQHDFFPDVTAPIFQEWADEGAAAIQRVAGS